MHLTEVSQCAFKYKVSQCKFALSHAVHRILTDTRASFSGQSMFSTGRLDEPQHVQGNTSQGERGERGGQILPQNQSVQPPHPPSLLLFSKSRHFHSDHSPLAGWMWYPMLCDHAPEPCITFDYSLALGGGATLTAWPQNVDNGIVDIIVLCNVVASNSPSEFTSGQQQQTTYEAKGQHVACTYVTAS